MAGIIDFHSHVLPGIDDGSHSLEESIAMLDLVIDNRAYELEQAFDFGANSAVNSIVLNEKEPASTFASASKSIASKIEKTLNQIGAAN